MNLEIPDALPNPYSLTTLVLVKGLKNNSKRLLIGTYDGQVGLKVHTNLGFFIGFALSFHDTAEYVYVSSFVFCLLDG